MIPVEFSKTHQSTETSQSDTAFQTIATYIEKETLESARFQAFADYADLQSTYLLRAEGGVYNKALIQETIRQRINSVGGYKREHEEIQGMIRAFEMTLRPIFPDQHVQGIISNRLTQIKDRQIGKNSVSVMQAPTR